MYNIYIHTCKPRNQASNATINVSNSSILRQSIVLNANTSREKKKVARSNQKGGGEEGAMDYL